MDNENDIVLIVVSGTLLMMLFIGAIILFVITYNKKIQQKNNEHTINIKEKELEMLKQVIETQESERDKIASNLHDEVGPLLSKLKLDMSSFKRAFDKGTLTAEKLNDERKFVDTIIDNVRSVSHDLSPQFLLKFGIVKAVRNYTSNFDCPIVKVTGDVEDIELPRSITVNMYRIILELVNNTLKHDDPQTMEILFKTEKGLRVAQISHDGAGISNEDFEKFAKESKGIGLTSIQTRVIILNANLDFELKSNGKSCVKLSIPMV